MWRAVARQRRLVGRVWGRNKGAQPTGTRVQLTDDVMVPGKTKPTWRAWIILSCIPMGLVGGYCYASYQRWLADQQLYLEFLQNEAEVRVSAMSDEELLAEGRQLGLVAHNASQ